MTTRTKQRELKAVLFDLDDTLFDHIYSCRQALRRLVEGYVCFQKDSFEEFSRIYDTLMEEYHAKFLAGGMTLNEVRAARTRALFAYYETQADEQIVAEAVRHYVKTYRQERRAVVGGIKLLEELHGKVHIAVVTNNQTSEQVEKLQECKLEALVDTLVTSEDVGVAKPNPAIFEATLERIGCQANEVVMIGDSWTADILGARRAGIRAIWLNRMGKPCPDPKLAQEIQAWEPLEAVLEAIGL